jgi:cephalosporin-C deacetylase
MNFADRISGPAFLGLGLQDPVCPPATIFSVYNRLSGTKRYTIFPHARHHVGGSHHGERRKWLLEQFRLKR